MCAEHNITVTSHSMLPLPAARLPSYEAHPSARPASRFSPPVSAGIFPMLRLTSHLRRQACSPLPDLATISLPSSEISPGQTQASYLSLIYPFHHRPAANQPRSGRAGALSGGEGFAPERGHADMKVDGRGNLCMIAGGVWRGFSQAINWQNGSLTVGGLPKRRGRVAPDSICFIRGETMTRVVQSP